MQLKWKPIKPSLYYPLGELLNKMGVIVIEGNGPEINIFAPLSDAPAPAASYSSSPNFATQRLHLLLKSVCFEKHNLEVKEKGQDRSMVH